MGLPQTLETNMDRSVLEFETSDNNNSFVNPLKKKLPQSDQEETIPLKKRHTESFFGSPNTVTKLLEIKNLIEKHKGIEKLHDWQEECLNLSAIHEKRNLVYTVPTSGGKTLVAEILMLKEIVCQKKNALFILPYVASVQEKIELMKPFAMDLNFLIEEYCIDNDQTLPNKVEGKNSMYVCTIEKGQCIINYLIELNRLDEIGIIVVDELHLLGESSGRGATLECLLTKVIHSECNARIIGMSATIGNLEEIARFLNAKLYERNFRPVGIKEYVKCGPKTWLINSEERNMLTNEKIIEHKYTREDLERDPDFLGYFVFEVVPEDSCLVFCSTKKNCESVVTLLTDLAQGQEKWDKSHKRNEKLALLNALKNESEQICPVLKRTIPYGFAYHHSGLTTKERTLIEEAFRSGVLCVICCTSTLATGVNLPARRVIIRSPYISTQFLNVSRYKQMIGRAGRTGLREVGESFLVSSRKDFKKVRELLSSKIDDSMSRLHKDKDRGIKNLIASAVLLSMASTRADLHKLVSKTLLKVQEGRLLKPGVSLKNVADEALATLIKDGILIVKKEDFVPLKFSTDVLEIKMNEYEKAKGTEEIKVVKLTNSTQLELCPLGKAAVKGLIDLETALVLYQNLKSWIETRKAEPNLESEDQFLHLISVITPCEIAHQIIKFENDHCDVILRLPDSKMQVARLLGINETTMINIRKGNTITPDFATVLKKFYVTLILHELSQQQSIYDVGKKYEVDHRKIRSLLSSASSTFSLVVRFCQEMDEFQMFTVPLSKFAQKLTHYGAAELRLLMTLPCVQEKRATQLHKAGYSTVQSIAKANLEEMLAKVRYLTKEHASQIISEAEELVKKKEVNLPNEAERAMSNLEI